MPDDKSKIHIRKIIDEPTIIYELTRVMGGRSPKTEIRLKLSGDVARLHEELDNKNISELMIKTRDVFAHELDDLKKRLEDIDDVSV